MRGKMRILTVDDEQDILDILSDCLESTGHEVVQALNGEQAMEQLRQNGPFDLILTDLSMPVMCGRQLIEKARAAGIKTEIVVVSTGDVPADERQRLNIKMVINKPFRLDELSEHLSGLVTCNNTPQRD